MLREGGGKKGSQGVGKFLQVKVGEVVSGI